MFRGDGFGAQGATDRMCSHYCGRGFVLALRVYRLFVEHHLLRVDRSMLKIELQQARIYPRISFALLVAALISQAFVLLYEFLQEAIGFSNLFRGSKDGIEEAPVPTDAVDPPSYIGDREAEDDEGADYGVHLSSCQLSS
jgi:hypothetical protein